MIRFLVWKNLLRNYVKQVTTYLVNGFKIKNNLMLMYKVLRLVENKRYVSLEVDHHNLSRNLR